MTAFEKGDLVAVCKSFSGTFGGIESDWQAGVYACPVKEENMHAVWFLPASKDARSRRMSLVEDWDIRPAAEVWEFLNGCRMEESLE